MVDVAKAGWKERQGVPEHLPNHNFKPSPVEPQAPRSTVIQLRVHMNKPHPISSTFLSPTSSLLPVSTNPILPSLFQLEQFGPMQPRSAADLALRERCHVVRVKPQRNSCASEQGNLGIFSRSFLLSTTIVVACDALPESVS